MMPEDHRRLLGRRQAIVALGLGGLGVSALWRAAFRRGARTMLAAVGGSVPAVAECVLSPEQTEGPFYVSNELIRRDITDERAGFPLKLRLTVRDATTCKPIEGADVELWHCDADGVYSGVRGPTDDTTFLRGHQARNRRGRLRFDTNTIYPGWYPGRTPHLHVKVHVGGAVVHTGQLYFDDQTTSAVYQQEPYAARGEVDTTNATDFIYASGGAQSMLALRKRRRSVRGAIILAVET
jgi:protocatechuate 3,4-dioxygenase beta subunit